MEDYKNTPDPLSNTQAIAHLKNALADGRDWVHALLESMSIWRLQEEVYQQEHHRYLLDGEAFDWILLAERLLEEVDGLVPEQEKKDLLFSGHSSPLITQDDFRNLLGSEKYSAYLNYWYGVVVEEAVIHSAEEEERKGLHAGGLLGYINVTSRAFRKVYGIDRETLQQQFCDEKGYSRALSFSPTQVKEFTYWLFKYRLINSEGERVASDTRKGILYMQRMRSGTRSK